LDPKGASKEGKSLLLASLKRSLWSNDPILAMSSDLCCADETGGKVRMKLTENRERFIVDQ
jgi:hypothetical protein